MPKAYWIARVDVRDALRYPEYIETARPAMERFGARFLVRGGRTQSLEGENRARNVVIEFDNVDDALGCYHSAEYRAAAKIRQAVSEGELIIVEGVPIGWVDARTEADFEGFRPGRHRVGAVRPLGILRMAPKAVQLPGQIRLR